MLRVGGPLISHSSIASRDKNMSDAIHVSMSISKTTCQLSAKVQTPEQPRAELCCWHPLPAWALGGVLTQGTAADSHISGRSSADETLARLKAQTNGKGFIKLVRPIGDQKKNKKNARKWASCSLSYNFYLFHFILFIYFFVCVLWHKKWPWQQRERAWRRWLCVWAEVPHGKEGDHRAFI